LTSEFLAGEAITIVRSPEKVLVGSEVLNFVEWAKLNSSK
jgi:hypothetical protein